jgi:hypothetical protein
VLTKAQHYSCVDSFFILTCYLANSYFNATNFPFQKFCTAIYKTPLWLPWLLYTLLCLYAHYYHDSIIDSLHDYYKTCELYVLTVGEVVIQENMVMSPAIFRTKNGCVGEGQQHFNRPTHCRHDSIFVTLPMLFLKRK